MRVLASLVLATVMAFGVTGIAGADEATAPIKALLVTGGCCHDYPFQTRQYIQAAKDRGVDVEGTVVMEGGTGTSAEIDDWREFLGVTSRRHEHQSLYEVVVAGDGHWITANIPEGYKTPMDELYVIEKVWPNTQVLATSTSEKTNESHPVIWTNTYGEARVFGTTYGHSVDTFSDATFLDVIVRGLQWAAEREPTSP